MLAWVGQQAEPWMPSSRHEGTVHQPWHLPGAVLSPCSFTSMPAAVLTWLACVLCTWLAGQAARFKGCWQGSSAELSLLCMRQVSTEAPCPSRHLSNPNSKPAWYQQHQLQQRPLRQACCTRWNC
jgi:hypothetical protein